MMNYKFFYWGPYLWKSQLNREIVDGLLERGIKSRDKQNEKLASLIEDTRRYSIDDKIWFAEKIEPYIKCYLDTHKDFMSCHPISKKSDRVEMGDIWINFQKKHEFNPEHTHSQDLSFVIYLQIPDTLVEENKNYKGQSSGPGSVVFRYGEASNWAISHIDILPEVGDLLIFPAMLAHYVIPFTCEGTRISVSGNFSYV